jgi:peptide/nickel transport system permease protein
MPDASTIQTDNMPGSNLAEKNDVISSSLIKDSLKRLRRNKSAVAGAVIAIALLLIAILAPVIAPHDPLEQDLANRLSAPTASHLLGTDDLGRDIISRIIYGTRISLRVGLISVGIALVIGTFLGSVAGYYGMKIDSIIMRLMDIMLAFPSTLLAIGVVAVLGPSLNNAMIAIGVVAIPQYARIVRSSVLSVKTTEYIEAARALGATDARIIFRHVLPNCLAPIIVQATLGVATAILDAAALSFLGLGAQPPTPEWGAMLAGGRPFLRLAPWVIAFPGIAIVIVVMGLNLFGDGLRDALDPRLKR